MLVLSRKQNEVIVIDSNIRITVVSIRGIRSGSASKLPAEFPSSARSLSRVLPPKCQTTHGRPRLSLTSRPARLYGLFSQNRAVRRCIAHDHTIDSVLSVDWSVHHVEQRPDRPR